MIAFLLLITSSFAKKAKNTQPCWILAPCQPYDTQEYLVGVGSGQSIEEADTAAMGALSRQFTVQIKQTQSSTKELVQTTRDQDVVSSTDHQNLRSKTEVSSDITLEHVIVPEHYVDSKSGIVYALAVIHRDTWMTDLTQQRMQIQEEMNALFFQMRQSPSLIAHFSLYPPLKKLADLDMWLSKQQQIISADGISMPPSHTHQSLTADQERKIQSIILTITTEDTALYNLSSQVLQNKGYTIQNTAPLERNLNLRIHVSSQTLPQDAYGFIKIEGLLKVEIWAGEGHFATIEKSVQAASQKLDKAQRGFDQALSQELSNLDQDIQAILRPK